jgi:hypothetical protein
VFYGRSGRNVDNFNLDIKLVVLSIYINTYIICKIYIRSINYIYIYIYFFFFFQDCGLNAELYAC